MKKSLLKTGIILLSLFTVLSCKQNIELPDPSEAQFIIDGSTLQSGAWAFYTKELSENNTDAIVSFSCKMFVVNNSANTANLMWQINIDDKEYPWITVNQFKTGTTNWTSISGSQNVSLKNNNVFYLSTYQLTPSDFKIYVKDFVLKVATDTKTTTYTPNGSSSKDFVMSDNNWLNDKVPSLAKTYSGIIDYVGFAATGSELTNKNIQNGLKKHANTTTMGNEFKPDSICSWWGGTPQIDGKFTASNGVTIDTPKLNGIGNINTYLSICKDLGIKMRGHVLVWHSQTPEGFFREDYNSSKSFVDKATMTARQEWYIKTVLEAVKSWEDTNNNGEHIVWAWDVVNEAIADGTSSSLRTESNWYMIYKSNEFIINAFRFANKYAPSDVKLCYNDYNEYEAAKMSGISSLLDAIIAKENDETLPTRIDAMGMQSHAGVNIPSSSIQTAITKYVSKGLDIHVTELDIATETSYNPSTLATRYGEYFTVYKNNRKTDQKPGVECVTIWGFNDESTWLNTPSQQQWHGNTTQYPLLLEKNSEGEFVTKKAFDSVIAAATN